MQVTVLTQAQIVPFREATKGVAAILEPNIGKDLLEKFQKALPGKGTTQCFAKLEEWFLTICSLGNVAPGLLPGGNPVCLYVAGFHLGRGTRPTLFCRNHLYRRCGGDAEEGTPRGRDPIYASACAHQTLPQSLRKPLRAHLLRSCRLRHPQSASRTAGYRYSHHCNAASHVCGHDSHGGRVPPHDLLCREGYRLHHARPCAEENGGEADDHRR